MKFLYFTDPHVSDSAPASRKDDYKEAIFEKYAQIGKIIQKLNVNFVVCGGDWFNIKAASRNSHALVRQTIDALKGWGKPVVTVVGSHDFPWNQLDRLAKQPMGVMLSAGVTELLDFWTGKEKIFTENLPEKKIKVKIIGFNDDGKTSLESFKQISKQDEDWLVAVVHHAASPERNASKFFDAFCYEDLVDFAPDVWCFGHWHIDQGVVGLKSSEGKDKFFISPGALSRGAYNDENIDRIPKIIIVELNGIIRITPIALNVGSKEDVFDVEKIEKLKEKDREISKFIEELSVSSSTDEFSDLQETVKNLDISQKVREQISFYLEKALDER